MSEFAQVSTRPVAGSAEMAVRAAVVRAPLQLLGQENKGDLARLKRELGPPVRRNAAEVLMAGSHFLDYLDRARFAATTDALFLRAGLDPNLATLGLFGKAVTTSETLWDALLMSKQLMSRAQSWSSVDLHLKSGRCRVAFVSKDLRHPGQIGNIQYFVSLFVYLLRQCEDYRAANLRVYYPGAKPLHSIVFPDAARIKSAHFGMIEFDDDLLRRPMRYADPWLQNVSQSAVTARHADGSPVTALPELIEILQRSSVASHHGVMGLKETARLMDMPTRTLQAALNARGSSFGAIRSAVQHNIARAELAAGRSIAETGAMLGFQHRQSFSEAFSKWEDCAPSMYQAGQH